MEMRWFYWQFPSWLECDGHFLFCVTFLFVLLEHLVVMGHPRIPAVQTKLPLSQAFV